MQWGRFLDGARGATSLFGIFPKHPPRAATKYELMQKAKAAEEEQKKKQEEEAAWKQSKAAAASLSKPVPAFGQRGQAGKAQSKEEQRRLQREEQRRREAEKEEADRLQKEEDEAVKVEARRLKMVVQAVAKKVADQGGDVRAWFKLFDRDKNGRLDRKELGQVLRQAGARPGEQELDSVFRLLDTSGDGRVTGTEFCDVVDGKVLPEYEKFVRTERGQVKQRERQEADKRALAANLRSVGADIGSTEAGRDAGLGPIDGMSSIMETAADQRAPVKLIDDEANLLRVQGEIKELLSKDPSGKPRTFDDILPLMGKPVFQKEAHVTLTDFEAVVKGVGGQKKF